MAVKFDSLSPSAKRWPYSAAFCWAWGTAASTPSSSAFWDSCTQKTVLLPLPSLSLFRYYMRQPFESMMVGMLLKYWARFLNELRTIVVSAKDFRLFFLIYHRREKFFR